MTRHLGLVLLLLLTATAAAQQLIADRPIPHFEVHAESRLTALARLGSTTNTSLLLEPGDLDFLQTPIDLKLDDNTLGNALTQVLRGPDPYFARQQGALLIISTTTYPNRLATLPLGPLSFDVKPLSALIPPLSYFVRNATGCEPSGYMWAGPLFALDIPPFRLADATLEQVVAQVALAPEPTFWLIPPVPQSTGCVDDPAAHWMIGFYGFGREGTTCSTAFRATIGVNVAARSTSPLHAHTGCDPHLSTPPNLNPSTLGTNVNPPPPDLP